METEKESEYSARGRVIHHLLELINRSGLGELVVLRGSLLMKAWYGDAAREPGDIDWVLRDDESQYKPTFFRERLKNFLRSVAKHSDVGGVRINSRKIVEDAINTKGEYQSLVGRRLIFPWQSAGKASGTIQMDFAFDEVLRVSPSWTAIPNPVGEETRVWAVSKEESLAWKIVWLEHDAGNTTPSQLTVGTKPKGKDLYDAVLLAEDIFLPMDLLLRVCAEHYWYMTSANSGNPFGSEAFPLMWDVDWEPFQKEHPKITGWATDWQMRLAYALSPTFSAEERERAHIALSFQ
ncbi:MAG: nucleotidyl transferase AbiEii/AbiGii toxin family protein [Akkermansiaceae bacterium]|nr:nucleotidyl transferase AbiEii/AbiGii toxin family protein [Armatimonadota bacterium]